MNELKFSCPHCDSAKVRPAQTTGTQLIMRNGTQPINPGTGGARLSMNHSVAQVGNLLCRRLRVGGRSNVEPLRIANPRYGRLPVCATPFRFMITMHARFWN